ncbi:MAG TPA: YHYH protein [Polyangia bacterium]|nr:YHYH protein [Polyangia bacterium]
MRLLLLARVAALAAWGAAGCGAPPNHVAITAPTIWLQASASIDPTRLPLCDQCYDAVTVAQPQKGRVFACDPQAYQQINGPGGQGGPWLDVANATFDFTARPIERGRVYWDDAQLTVSVSGDQRSFGGNGLPLNTPTGIYPLPADDPAYQYDRNPNAISAQAIAFSLPANPTVDPQGPHCAYKRVGITLDGIQLHGPIDSHGRDEIAYQLQDVCTGDPQPGGGYHHHVLSECMPHIHENNALVGYALDGFGIFSPYDAAGKELTSADLDECHGLTSTIEWDGQSVVMYHYVLTRDFPYTLTCFRGKPLRNAFPPLPGAPPEENF